MFDPLNSLQLANEQRSAAEVRNFTLQPLPYGRPYYAYLSAAKPQHTAQNDRLGCPCDMRRGVITTWMGDLLAIVLSISSYRALPFGRNLRDTRGSFRAIGIDGRMYHGTHNGCEMCCTLRLARWQDEYDIEQHTSEGWETVSRELTHFLARGAVREYRENQPDLAVRVKHRRVRQ